MNIMDILNIINAIVVVVGLPLILKSMLFVGRKLQLLDSIADTIKNQIEPAIAEIRHSLFEVDKRLTVSESRQEALDNRLNTLELSRYNK